MSPVDPQGQEVDVWAGCANSEVGYQLAEWLGPESGGQRPRVYLETSY